MSSEVVLRNLSERQETFARLLAKGVPIEAAAESAGYAQGESGYRALALPQVLRAVHLEVQRQLQGELAPTALRVLRRILNDEKASERVRADIGVKLLNMAGHVAPTPAGQTDQSDKSLSEMSAEELLGFIGRNQAEIDRLEAELAARAKDVSPALDAQDNTQDGAKPLTYLD